jgi:hypothetical protein
MRFVLETDNAFHAGWLAAHLGLTESPPPALSGVCGDSYRDGHAMYRETWPDRSDSPAVIAGRTGAEGDHRLTLETC